MGTNILAVCMSVFYMHVWYSGKAEEISDLLELELWESREPEK